MRIGEVTYLNTRITAGGDHPLAVRTELDAVDDL